MKLDEQFFQSLLSAAFTIQEYNGRAFAGCATAYKAEAAELLHRATSSSTPRLEAIEPVEGAGEKRGQYEKAAEGTAGPTDCLAPNLYLDLLKSIEGEDGERKAAEKVDPKKEDSRGTNRLTDSPRANVYVDALRIIESDEGEEEAAGEGLNLSKEETEGTEHQEGYQAEHQVAQTLEQHSPCTNEQLPAKVCDSQIEDHLLRLALQQVLQLSRATTAAIALGHQGKLICRDSMGESASEIAAMIDTGSGFTGVCASVGTMQFCANTMLDPRADAQACQKVGARAFIVIPLFDKNQFLGLIAAFSRRPYAFGVREVQALQDLVEKFTANLQVSAAPANTTSITIATH